MFQTLTHNVDHERHLGSDNRHRIRADVGAMATGGGRCDGHGCRGDGDPERVPAAVHPAAPPEPESLLPPAHRQHGRHRRAAGQPASQLVAKSVNKSVSLLVCQLVRLSVSQSVS